MEDSLKPSWDRIDAMIFWWLNANNTHVTVDCRKYHRLWKFQESFLDGITAHKKAAMQM